MSEVEVKKKSQWTARPQVPLNPDPNFLPLVSMKDQFNEYIDSNFETMTLDDRKVLWNKVSMEMISLPIGKLITVIEKFI